MCLSLHVIPAMFFTKRDTSIARRKCKPLSFCHSRFYDVTSHVLPVAPYHSPVLMNNYQLYGTGNSVI